MSQPRWHAPSENGATLVVPPWPELPGLIEENQRLVKESTLRLDGRNLTELRQWAGDCARSSLAAWYGELVWPAATLKTPLIVTGHQPELFHPGVWAKNVAISKLARQLGGRGLNINVDSDVAKSTAIKLPVLNDEVAQQSFTFSHAKAPLPYEEWLCEDETMFEGFPQTVQAVTEQWPWQPILPEFWKSAVAARSKARTLPERWIIARHQWEVAQQVSNEELTMSRWCSTPFFGWMVGLFITEHARFAGIYNDELKRYRQEHRIRSANHPVADLLVDGDLVELPFWAWPTGTTQRARLCARMEHGRIKLVALVSGKEMILSDTQDSALSTQDFSGWKIRPKALITSMMFRLFLADLFVHGIGGAVYDELTDRIFSRFWSVTLPRFAIVTATLRLPWDRTQVTEVEPRSLRQTLRRLQWNPDEYLNEPVHDETRRLILQKRKLRASPATMENYLDRHQQYESIRSQLGQYVTGKEQSVSKKLTEVLHDVRRDEQHFSREHPWVLYPQALLEGLIRAF